MNSLKNKTVVITGVGRGLGAALAEVAAKAGAFVSGFDIAPDNLDKLSNQFVQKGYKHYFEVVDISKENEVNQFFNNLIQKTNQIDILINNAGITNIKLFRENTNEEIKRVMDINFMGSVYCTRSALPLILSSKGSIAAISSVAGFAPLTGRTAYAASKHAVLGFFETLRTEVKGNGVHVMVVCPSFIDTELRANTYKAGEDNTNTKAKIGKNDSPEEVATLIFKGINERKDTLVTGKVGRIAYFLKRVSPELYEKMMFKNARETFGL